MVFAADLGGTKLAGAAVTRAGVIKERIVEPVDRSSKFAAVAQIKRMAQRLANDGPPSKAFIAGGIAVPGLVRRSGTVWAPNLPGWERVPLGSRLQRGLGIPFAVESDRNAAALGETWLGAARGKEDAVLLIIGTGIGAGMISGGRLVRGAHELSGCAGWMVVSDDYPAEARRIGQLESLTAGPSVARAAADLLKQGQTSALTDLGPDELTGVAVAKAARGGDKLARSVFDHIGRTLGRGIANIISLFDPEVVVIGGGMADSANLFLPTVMKTVRQFAQPLSAPQTKIRVSHLRGDANLLGVAKLAWSKAQERSSAASSSTGD
jgi:glucokinase